MSVDIYTSAEHLNYQRVLDHIRRIPSYVTTPAEHEELPMGSIIRSSEGYARRQSGGWSYFGVEGVIPTLSGEHEVIRSGELYIPELFPATGEFGNEITSLKVLINDLIPIYTEKFKKHTYTNFRELLDLPEGALIGTYHNDYQRHPDGWRAAGSTVSTSSQGIVRYREAYLIHA